jgi:hypothetical protein
MSSPLDVFCLGFSCSFCHATKERMTIWQHVGPVSSWGAVAKGDIHVPISRVLYLCFMGCQHFPEPFKANLCTDENHWTRVDRWPGYRPQIRIRKAGQDWRSSLQEMGRDHQQP